MLAERGAKVVLGARRTERLEDLAARVDPALRGPVDAMLEHALTPDAVARAVAFAVEQPDGVDVGEIVVRPTAQG